MGVTRGLLRVVPRPASVAFVAVAVVPLAAVLQWGWRPGTLAVYLWLQVGAVMWWSLAKSLVATREFEFGFLWWEYAGFTTKRGARRLCSWLPPVYPRNLPNVVVYATGMCWGWVAMGAVVLAFGVGDVAGFLAGPGRWVLALAALTALGRGLVAYLGYVRWHQYERCSVGQLNHQTIEYAVVVGTLALLCAGMAADATVDSALVAAVIVVGYELLRQRPGVLYIWANALTRRLGHDPPAPTPSEIDGPTTASIVTVDADPRVVFRAAIPKALDRDVMVQFWGLVIAYVAMLGLLSVGGTVPWQVWALFGLVAAYAFGVLYPIQIAEYVLLYGPMRYHRTDEALVAVDRWFDEPQWHVPLTDVAAVHRERGRVDRALGTVTLAVETTDGRTRRLAHLPAVDVLGEGLPGPT